MAFDTLQRVFDMNAAPNHQRPVGRLGEHQVAECQGRRPSLGRHVLRGAGPILRAPLDITKRAIQSEADETVFQPPGRPMDPSS
jgi:hypothetical protein